MSSSASLPERAVQVGTPLQSGHGHLARWAHFYLMVGSLVAPLLLWELASAARLVSPVLYPAPSKIGAALVRILGEGYFPKHVWATTYEATLGFGIGSLVGIVLGTLLALIPPLRHTLYPYIVAFQALPKIVLAPLFVTAFGFGPESKIATAVAICFFPLMMNTLVGLTLVDPQALRLMQALRASEWQVLRKLRFPNALPHVFAGFQTSATFAITGALVAELVTGGGSEGLGRLVDLFGQQLEIALQFAVVLLISIIGVAVVLAMEWIDRRVVFWRD